MLFNDCYKINIYYYYYNTYKSCKILRFLFIEIKNSNKNQILLIDQITITYELVFLHILQ